MVTSMLEKAIEIEGLLRIIRDGNPLPETYILLNMKAAELAEQAETLEEKSTATVTENPREEPAPEPIEEGKQHAEPAEALNPAPEPILPENEKPHGDFVMATPEAKNQRADFVLAAPAEHSHKISEVVFNADQPEAEEESLTHTIESLSDLGEDDYSMTPEDLSLIEEDDILLSFEDTTEFQLPTAPSEPIMPIKEEKTEENETSEKETDAASDATESQETESISMNQVSAESEPTPTPEETTPKRKIKLKSAFSLNDRFLYARELFNGNMKMFDSTLDFLEGIEDYSIIEDYFYSELEWNPENTHVATFMDILRPHFKE